MVPPASLGQLWAVDSCHLEKAQAAPVSCPGSGLARGAPNWELVREHLRGGLPFWSRTLGLRGSEKCVKVGVRGAEHEGGCFLPHLARGALGAAGATASSPSHHHSMASDSQLLQLLKLRARYLLSHLIHLEPTLSLTPQTGCPSQS